MSHDPLLFRYRLSLSVFIAGLVLSGLTAFPLLHELELLSRLLGCQDAPGPEGHARLPFWILTVRNGLRAAHAAYPWMAYGTDWLAFGHLTIALFFIAPFRNPLPNDWVLKTGLLACAGIIPLALICGAIRGIPFYWRLIDCSFGIFGAIPLFYCLAQSRKFRATQTLE